MIANNNVSEICWGYRLAFCCCMKTIDNSNAVPDSSTSDRLAIDCSFICGNDDNSSDLTSS